MISKDLRFRKKWIEWVLNFERIDLNNLTTTMKEKIAEEAYFFISDFLQTFDESRFWEGRKQKKGEYETDRTAEVLKKIQSALVPLVVVIDKNTATSKRKGPFPHFSYDLKNVAPFLTVGQGVDGDCYTIGFRPDYKSEGDWSVEQVRAVINFSQLLLGLPLHSIKKCKGCDRYFLEITQREKEFCTSSCYARWFAREKMAKLKRNKKKYDDFKKDRRLYMQKRYKDVKLGKWPKLK